MTERPTGPVAGDGRDQRAGSQLAIKRIYVKDVSFEVPLGLEAFGQQWQPRVNQDIAAEVKRLQDNEYEVVLNITIAVQQEEKVLYVVEVHQAGVFLVAGFEASQLAHALNTRCPAILFPYARELIDSLVVRGNFPPLMLPPINFEVLFQQAMREKAQSELGGVATPSGKPN
jgi:preprotein translocase subunit SecB